MELLLCRPSAFVYLAVFENHLPLRWISIAPLTFISITIRIGLVTRPVWKIVGEIAFVDLTREEGHLHNAKRLSVFPHAFKLVAFLCCFDSLAVRLPIFDRTDVSNFIFVYEFALSVRLAVFPFSCVSDNWSTCVGHCTVTILVVTF